MNKKLIGLIIIIIIIFGFIFYLDSEFSISPQDKKKTPKEEPKNKTNHSEEKNESIIENKTKNNDSSLGGSFSGGSGGGGSSGDGGSSDLTNETEPKIPLPDDINTSDCGLYYEKYGECRGTCPEGECISSGGSCYCQKT